MIRSISSVVLLVICFITPSLRAQENIIEVHNHLTEVNLLLDAVISANDEHMHTLVASDHDFQHSMEEEHDKVHGFIALSLDEIISSDDSIDFNCTGGFCMKKSHTHKKGLSTQRQLFDYFMRIKA